MGRHDWYRATRWDAEIAEEFEKRLARARRENRSDYLRIQGVYLRDSARAEDRGAGVELLLRAVIEAPGSIERTSARQSLAHSLVEQGPTAEAVDALRETIRLIKSSPTGISGTTGVTELELAELLIRIGGPDNVAEAVDLLIAVESSVGEGATAFIAMVQLRFNVTCARAASLLGNPAAGTYARRALSITDNGTPTFRRHPELGQAALGPQTRAELEETSAANPDDKHFSGAREAFRGPSPP